MSSSMSASTPTELGALRGGRRLHHLLEEAALIEHSDQQAASREVVVERRHVESGSGSEVPHAGAVDTSLDMSVNATPRCAAAGGTAGVCEGWSGSHTPFSVIGALLGATGARTSTRCGREISSTLRRPASRWSRWRGKVLSDRELGQEWWLASDGKWYPPERHTGASATGRSPNTTRWPSEEWTLAADGKWYPGTVQRSPRWWWIPTSPTVRPPRSGGGSHPTAVVPARAHASALAVPAASTPSPSLPQGCGLVRRRRRAGGSPRTTTVPARAARRRARRVRDVPAAESPGRAGGSPRITAVPARAAWRRARASATSLRPSRPARAGGSPRITAGTRLSSAPTRRRARLPRAHARDDVAPGRVVGPPRRGRPAHAAAASAPPPS